MKLIRIVFLRSLLSSSLLLLSVDAFVTFAWLSRQQQRQPQSLYSAKVGDLLSDLDTPSLLMELSLAERNLPSDTSLDEILVSSSTDDDVKRILDGSIFVHTKIIDTSIRDEITNQYGSGKSTVIGNVDFSTISKYYLGIGLANHIVGGYYWARGMGMGASLPAHGIELVVVVDNDMKKKSQLVWTKRGLEQEEEQSQGTNDKHHHQKRDMATATTEESSNSNDGKRSEWADFLVVGDTVQLVPYHVEEALFPKPTATTDDDGFEELLGIRRIGRPLGADPIVERIWKRNDDGHGWVPKPS
eukprot:scaffold2322_cov135-Cylindrotheca_fusiformis.AAC.22